MTRKTNPFHYLPFNLGGNNVYLYCLPAIKALEEGYDAGEIDEMSLAHNAMEDELVEELNQKDGKEN